MKHVEHAAALFQTPSTAVSVAMYLLFHLVMFVQYQQHNPQIMLHIYNFPIIIYRNFQDLFLVIVHIQFFSFWTIPLITKHFA